MRPCIWNVIEDREGVERKNNNKSWSKEDKEKLARIMLPTLDKVMEAADMFDRTPTAILLQIVSFLDASNFCGNGKDICESVGVFKEITILHPEFINDIKERIEKYGENLNPKKEKIVFSKR